MPGAGNGKSDRGSGQKENANNTLAIIDAWQMCRLTAAAAIPIFLHVIVAIMQTRDRRVGQRVKWWKFLLSLI